MPLFYERGVIYFYWTMDFLHDDCDNRDDDDSVINNARVDRMIC